MAHVATIGKIRVGIEAALKTQPLPPIEEITFLVDWLKIFEQYPADKIITVDPQGSVGIYQIIENNKNYISEQLGRMDDKNTNKTNDINDNHVVDEKNDMPEAANNNNGQADYLTNPGYADNSAKDNINSLIDKVVMSFQQTTDILLEVAKNKTNMDVDNHNKLIDHILASHETSNHIVKVLSNFQQEQRIMHEKLNFVANFIHAQMKINSNIQPVFDCKNVQVIEMTGDGISEIKY